MATIISFKINGADATGTDEMYILEAAAKNGVYIPSLCNYKGLKPKGSCRICTVKVNGRLMTACTTHIQAGLEIETETPDLVQLRHEIVELLFAEGNHFCPSCEKAGDCELQALAYRFRITVPRFPYLFPVRAVEASNPKILKDQNRCILCKRCIRGIKDENQKSLFAFANRGHRTIITIDTENAKNISDELAQKAMDICPVGAIIKKERGFITPYGKRKYDLTPIGSDVEIKI
jgi:[NiFe] hydrogenase diaphorase moiety small subunit